MGIGPAAGNAARRQSARAVPQTARTVRERPGSAESRYDTIAPFGPGGIAGYGHSRLPPNPAARGTALVELLNAKQFRFSWQPEPFTVLACR
jgi:hypothetical protein